MGRVKHLNPEPASLHQRIITAHRAGLAQQQIAKRLGCSQSTVSDVLAVVRRAESEEDGLRGKGKGHTRKYVGLRMRTSEIKRLNREMDAKHNRIEGVCPVCGLLIRKPRRGPTARFCSERCRKTWTRKKQAALKNKRTQAEVQTIRRFGRTAKDYRTRADASRARVIKIQKEERQVKEIIRISCLFQLAVILDHTPELIERAPARGYVAELMDEADRYGMPGDAKRMLEHRGYTGPTPQETKDEN